MCQRQESTPAREEGVSFLEVTYSVEVVKKFLSVSLRLRWKSHGSFYDIVAIGALSMLWTTGAALILSQMIQNLTK